MPQDERLKVNISGVACAFLQYDCLMSCSSLAGLLIGDVATVQLDEINDRLIENSTVKIINITSGFPVDLPFFHNYTDLDTSVLNSLIKDKKTVVGWFTFRKSNSPMPKITLKDKITHEKLSGWTSSDHPFIMILMVANAQHEDTLSFSQQIFYNRSNSWISVPREIISLDSIHAGEYCNNAITSTEVDKVIGGTIGKKSDGPLQAISEVHSLLHSRILQTVPELLEADQAHRKHSNINTLHPNVPVSKA